MDEQMQAYRSQLLAAEQKMQEDFDKTVLSLSGGALGISFAFITDVVGEGPLVQKSLLLAAWVVWGLSVTCVLASFYVSHLALRRAITQTDSGRIHQEWPGGRYDKVTAVLNAGGGLLFFLGVVLVVVFVSSNLPEAL